VAGVRVLAYAKLNLVLRVVGRRRDGYHLVQTLLCAVDLADELLLTDQRGLELVVEGEDVGPEEDNLALRAARFLQQRAGGDRGALIRLSKRIPAGAGLGGGSSDAAAVLAGLNRLWGLGLPLEELGALGATLGADVPFFLGPSPAWAEGIGEQLRPAQVDLPAAFLIAVPPFRCPTGEVYRAYDRLGVPYSSPTLGWEGELENDLWPAALALHPQLLALRDRLEGLGGPVGMTGSGSALFCAFPSEEEARLAARRLHFRGKVFVARPVGRGYKFVA
jgi:4-diphosphocytidyl-2-C-methyl-D-erythritol kinase